MRKARDERASAIPRAKSDVATSSSGSRISDLDDFVAAEAAIKKKNSNANRKKKRARDKK